VLKSQCQIALSNPCSGMASLPFGVGVLWSGVVPLRLKLIDPVGSNVKVKLVVFDGYRHGCLWVVVVLPIFFNGEFDPGSGRTLAACLTHASRTVRPLRGYTSGERVSNT
jgi:hypothetical protein